MNNQFRSWFTCFVDSELLLGGGIGVISTLQFEPDATVEFTETKKRYLGDIRRKEKWKHSVRIPLLHLLCVASSFSSDSVRTRHNWPNHSAGERPDLAAAVKDWTNTTQRNKTWKENFGFVEIHGVVAKTGKRWAVECCRINESIDWWESLARGY